MQNLVRYVAICFFGSMLVLQLPAPASQAANARAATYTLQLLHFGQGSFFAGWGHDGSIVGAGVQVKVGNRGDDRLALFVRGKAARIAPLPRGTSWESPQGMAVHDTLLYIASICGPGQSSPDGFPVIQTFNLTTGRWASTILRNASGMVPSVVPIDMDGNGYFLAQDFDTFTNLYWRPPYGRAKVLKLPSNVNVNAIQNVSQIEMVAGANRNGRTYEAFVSLLNSPSIPAGHAALPGFAVTSASAVGGQQNNALVAGVGSRGNSGDIPWVGHITIGSARLSITGATTLPFTTSFHDAEVRGVALTSARTLSSHTLTPTVFGAEMRSNGRASPIEHAVVWISGKPVDLNTETAVPKPTGVTFDIASSVDARGDIAGTATVKGRSEVFVLSRH